MPAPANSFITLGTAGGPMQNPMRAQPAHVFMHGDQPIMIDCGDGAMGQLARAGLQFRDVHHIFLTHHHFDHIGGLFAALGLNMMTQRRAPLHIYGPLGTRGILDGLLAACDGPQTIGFGVAGQSLPHPRDFIQVSEISPADTITLGDLRVTCCENTHYREEADLGTLGPVSLSLRFDALGRSVVFTGDTGPCAALETLALNADLIVGEMMDLTITMQRIRAMNPDMPEPRVQMIHQHLAKHHITVEDLAHLATVAGARRVVAVHFPPGIATPDTAQSYMDRFAAVCAAQFDIGQDLGVY